MRKEISHVAAVVFFCSLFDPSPNLTNYRSYVTIDHYVPSNVEELKGTGENDETVIEGNVIGECVNQNV